jgi:hypothetical protein
MTTTETTALKLSEIQDKMVHAAFSSLQTKYSLDTAAYGCFVGCLHRAGFFETPEVPKPTSTSKVTGEKKYSGWLLFLNNQLKMEKEKQTEKTKRCGADWKALGKEGQKSWNERAKAGEKPPTKSSKTTVAPAPSPAPAPAVSTVPTVTPVPAMVSATVPPAGTRLTIQRQPGKK